MCAFVCVHLFVCICLCAFVCVHLCVCGVCGVCGVCVASMKTQEWERQCTVLFIINNLEFYETNPSLT